MLLSTEQLFYYDREEVGGRGVGGERKEEGNKQRGRIRGRTGGGCTEKRSHVGAWRPHT